jgi:hypothetical protein
LDFFTKALVLNRQSAGLLKKLLLKLLTNALLTIRQPRAAQPEVILQVQRFLPLAVLIILTSKWPSLLIPL